MIVYNDTTQLQIANEPSWAGTDNLTFKTIPFLRDNFAPSIVQTRPQGLGQTVGRTAPITIEETAGGDLELLATMDHLALILPYILNNDPVTHSARLNGKTATAQGTLSLGFLPKKIRDGLINKDAVLLVTSTASRWLTVTHDNSQTPMVGGLTPSQAFAADDMVVIKSVTPGSTRKSACLVKSYRGATDKIRMNGGMISRLTLDLEEGALPVISASIIGKEMVVTQDAVTATPLSTDLPNTDLSQITMSLAPQTGTAFSLTNTIVTGFRLVMERPAMAPQFALGSTVARHISDGDLTIYGAVDFMIESHDVFTWMADQEALSLDLSWGDGGDEQIRIHAPHVTIAESRTTTADDGSPVHAVLQFEASRKDSLPIIKINLGER